MNHNDLSLIFFVVLYFFMVFFVEYDLFLHNPPQVEDEENERIS